MRDHLAITRLDPITRYLWPDGATFDARATDEDRERELARFAPRDLEGWKRLARVGQRTWDLAGELFLSHAPEQILRGRTNGRPGDDDRGSGRFSPVNAWKLLTVPLRIGMFSTFAGVVDRHLTSPKLREVLYQYATSSGASPFRAPATLAVIPHAEFYFGGWYVDGGMYRIAERLSAVARKLGVEIRTNAPVARILIEARSGRGVAGSAKPQVAGVVLADGTELRADAVIANSDAVYSYRELLDPAARPRYPDAKLDGLAPGGSGMVLLLGVDGTYPQLAHHTKFMPSDYASDLRAMFETRSIPDDPCIYVCASTRTDPTQAPNGCDNLFVRASAPALDGTIDWTIEGPRYRNQLIHTLERRGLTDLGKRIVVERWITPADLKSLYNANAGTIDGLGNNSRRAAFLRPPNRDRDVRGLYFCGGATHPGGGLPLVALSGKIVSELIMEHLG